MPHKIDLILTLTAGFTAALALGFATQKLRLSPIVGYFLAGILVGPFTPGYVADNDIATQFAEIGIILLMFGVGLHFHLKDLLAVRKVAIPGALVQIAAATGIGRGHHTNVWMVMDRGNRLWNGDIGCEHRRPDPGAFGQPSLAYAQRPYRHRLAYR